MNRLLASISLLAALASQASAQCFESSFGTLLGVGDDTLLALQPMNFVFPMPAGGVAASYTHAQANTNGNIYLTNGLASGGTATGYSTSAATMLTNMRGLAASPPRIACYWRDLNMPAANSGGVYYNNTIPGKFVITWKNAVAFGQTAPIFTVQAQLFATGEVRMFYSNFTNSSTSPLCGVSVGNAVGSAASLPVVLNTGGNISSIGLMYQTFTALSTLNLGNKVISFLPNLLGGYDQGVSACVPASATNYGSGCNFASATAYQNFPVNTINLQNANVKLSPNIVGGYDFTNGIGTNFVHTTTGLLMTDDSVATLVLPTAFNYPGGVTSSLTICSNGYIWMQPNVLADFSPTNAELFSNPARICPMWCDAVPDALHDVYAEVDAVNNKAYVTWSNVPIFGGVGGNCDLQTEFDLTTGVIEIRYGAISCGNVSIVGWTTGSAGPSVINTGNQSMIAGGFSTTSSELNALSLSIAPAPVLGSTVTYTTANITASAILSAVVVSFGGFDPGISLTGLGAPGCSQFVDLSLGNTSVYFGFPTVTSPLTIPNNSSFAGTILYNQAIALDPSANTLGILASNGVRLFLQGF
ncbi:MAG: hypothetical protein WCR59_01075 [Planctomycetota bacterium]